VQLENVRLRGNSPTRIGKPRRRASSRFANRAKDESGMLGHDLRNPLSPIVTGLQLMRMPRHEHARAGPDERQIAPSSGWSTTC